LIRLIPLQAKAPHPAASAGCGFFGLFHDLQKCGQILPRAACALLSMCILHMRMLPELGKACSTENNGDFWHFVDLIAETSRKLEIQASVD